MSERMPRLTPDQLDPAQRALYAQLTGSTRAGGPFRLTDPDGRLLGPFDAMLRNPPVGEAVQALGERLRYGGQLSDRARELVILAVAAHWGSVFERDAHERVGQLAGLAPTDLDAVRCGRDPVGLVAGETAALHAARVLLNDGDLADTEYEAVSAVLATADLFEVVWLVGYYSTLALTMRTFRADHPLGS